MALRRRPAERLVDATTHALETLGVYLGLELALYQALATFAGVARLRPRSSSTGSPTRSPTRTGRLALSRATQAGGSTGSGPARPLSGSRPSSGPPASTTRKGLPIASSRPWPFADDDRPSGSVHPLTQADLQAILAHLGDDPDQLLAGTGADRPVVAVRVRATVGRPGGSASRPGPDLLPGRRLTPAACRVARRWGLSSLWPFRCPHPAQMVPVKPFLRSCGNSGWPGAQSQSRRLKSRYRPPDKITISMVEVTTPVGWPNPG